MRSKVNPEKKRRGRKTRKKEHTKDDLNSLLPHLCDNRLARVNDTSEPDLDIFKLAKRLQDVFSCDTHGAQSMEDGPKNRNRRDEARQISQ